MICNRMWWCRFIEILLIVYGFFVLIVPSTVYSTAVHDAIDFGSNRFLPCYRLILSVHIGLFKYHVITVFKLFFQWVIFVLYVRNRIGLVIFWRSENKRVSWRYFCFIFICGFIDLLLIFLSNALGIRFTLLQKNLAISSIVQLLQLAFLAEYFWWVLVEIDRYFLFLRPLGGRFNFWWTLHCLIRFFTVIYCRSDVQLFYWKIRRQIGMNKWRLFWLILILYH